MTTYVALLRAVNVGGTGTLSMSELKARCAALGLHNVQTYIASGNVVFDAEVAPARLQRELEQALLRVMGKPVGVFLRTAGELRQVLEANPFAEQPPQHVYAFFLQQRPPASALKNVRGQTGESLGLGAREIYIHYPEGMGPSKLKLPAAQEGTARNLRTVAKLVEMCHRG